MTWFTRDSGIWVYGIITSVVLALASLSSNELPEYGLSAGFAPYLRLAALIIGIVSGTMRSSPLPHSGATEPAAADPPSLRAFPKVVLALALGGLLAGSACAPKAYHIATVSVVTGHSVLAFLQDSEKAAVCGQPTAPVPCIPALTHQQIAARFVTAFDLDVRVATAVRDTPVDKPLPTTVLGWMSEIQTEVQRILALLPEGAFKTAVLSRIGGGQ